MSTVIQINNLYKEYRLGLIGYGTLTRDLQSWWARVRGQEDPNSSVPLIEGQEQQIEGDRFWALSNVNFEVKEGQALGIIGQNGAGKSTLLKILSRVTAPTRGSIRVKGRIASLLEVGTGFHPELTGRENIFMNGAILGMAKDEIRLKIDEIIDFSGVEKFVDTPVKRYSSGMRVRLGFAVAAHLEPEILIVDEVLAVGDAEFQRRCLGKMQNVAEEGRTVLFVSHNMNAINNLCDRCILLLGGSVEEEGTPNQVIDTYLSLNRPEAVTSVVLADDQDKAFQILSGEIMVNGSVSVDGIIQVDQSFSIKIKYKFSRLLSGAYAVLLIRNQKDEIVLVSDNRDFLEENSLQVLGHIDAEVVLPLPLFVPGKYTITLSLAKQGQGTVDMQKNKLHFEIVDTKGARGQRAGYIYKPLEWHIAN